ncbi:MAG TPA: class I SAM-dependent methyltransferase, partial [Anaerolineae bacterium]|nr:class I SAM-dependent methyltransferase [Anaerolineae bacterium]
ANLDRIPAGVEIVFTDMSAGMVAEAQKNLATAANHFTFETANIASLHFADNSFDRVTANHMLYHVPDIDLAIGEVRRVLKPDGLFIAATNGESHLVELSEIGRILAPNSHWETHIKMTSYLSFNLENGAAYIKAHFNSATLHKHNSSLAVTEFEPLLAYLTSYNNIRPHITTASLAAARQYYAHILEQNDGVFPIQKATGLFRAA